MNCLQFYALFFLLFANLSFCKNIFENSYFAPVNDTSIETLENSSLSSKCSSLSDCGFGALECNSEKKTCVYPEYVCSNDVTCYTLDKDFDKEKKFNYSKASSDVKKCANDNECISNKCSEGQCIVNTESPNALCSVPESDKDNEPKYQCIVLDGNGIENGKKYNTSKTVNNENEDENASASSISVSSIGILIVIVIVILFVGSYIYMTKKVCCDGSRHFQGVL